MPSGLAKCHSDSYLQTFRTTLLSCKVAPKDDRRNINDKGETKEDNNKKGKKDGKEKDKGKVAEEVKVDSGAPALYDVQLQDTILFPEGGGQPSDMGTLKFNDIVAPVTYVYRDDQDEIFHRVLLSAPIPPQSEVELTLDWKRRWDHMQQHSGQHLISALAQKLLGWETKGWWMSKYPSPSYIEFGTKAASDEELERLEERVNSAIINPAPMRVHTFPSVEAAMQDENFRSRNVDDLSNLKGELRVVEIDGIDFNTCCGTHLQSTTHVQLVKFCGKEGNRGNTRVFFLAGARALHVFGRMIKREQEMTATICCGPDQHVDFAKQLQNDSKSLSKSTKNALAEVAALRGEKMAAEALAGGEQKTVLFFQHDEPTFPLSDMGDILQQRCPNHLALLVAGSLKQGHEGQFLLVGLGDRVTALGNEVAKIVGGRGGGRKGKFQGKIEKLAQKPLDAAVKYLNEQLHAAAPAAEPEKKQ